MAHSTQKLTKGLFIDGQSMPAASGRTYGVYNPATGEEIAHAADGDDGDARRAVASATRAFAGWSRVPAIERGALLRKAGEAMVAQKKALARQLTMEQGKPLYEAEGEIDYAAALMDWFAGEGERAYGDIIPPSAPGKRHFVLKQPVGVVAAITPWNFPVSMVVRKIAPALAAGCTVVLKPAEQTPLSALSLAEIFTDAGLPPGVLNVVTAEDPRDVGGELLHNPDIRKITFTGSTEVGKHLMREASEQVKRISLELGGHAPFIVFADADLDKAVAAAVRTKFRNVGQTCVSANRMYVHADVMDKFSRRLAEEAQGMPIGSGLDEGVIVGPLIDERAVEKVKLHVDDAVEKGAEVLAGGRVPAAPELARGCFYEPTVLAKVPEDARILREETFGPVAALIPFTSEAEVYEKANDSPYGLAAYLFTENLNRAIRGAERLEYGVVGVNEPVPGAAQVPFGGMKESGIGREGGAYGIQEFLEVKLVGMAVDETLD